MAMLIRQAHHTLGISSVKYFQRSATALLTIKTTVLLLTHTLALDVQLLSAKKMILQIALLALLGATYLPATAEAYKRVSTRANQA